MKTNCVVMIDTTQPQHAGGQKCAAIGGLLSFPDLKLPTGGRNSPRIKLMACGGLLQATALPYEASHQSNAVRRGNRRHANSGVPTHYNSGTVPGDSVGTVSASRMRQTSPESITAGLATGHRR